MNSSSPLILRRSNYLLLHHLHPHTFNAPIKSSNIIFLLQSSSNKQIYIKDCRFDIAKKMGAISSSQKTSTEKDTSMSGKAFTGLGNLIKLLPTGTVFMFQFLNPVLTSDGHCTVVNKYLTGVLLVVCAFNCCFATFTDSYTGSDGVRHYGIVTTKGVWPSPAAETVDLTAYRLRLGDFVHALFSLMVFAVLGLLDTNTVRCLYPEFESAQRILLQVLPPAIGVVSGAVFMMFPNNRHGIGYPASSDDSSASSQKS